MMGAFFQLSLQVLTSSLRGAKRRGNLENFSRNCEFLDCHDPKGSRNDGVNFKNNHKHL